MCKELHVGALIGVWVPSFDTAITAHNVAQQARSMPEVSKNIVRMISKLVG